MRLSQYTELFDFYGIPILGSRISGDVIGLDERGLAVCRRMQAHDVAPEEVCAADTGLADALEWGCFLEGSGQPDTRYVQAYVHVTQRCNLSCAGCYSLDENRNRLPDASRASFARAFEKLAGAGVRSVIVSGGEPFLRDDLPQLCADAKAAGIAHVTVLSNGLAITEQNVAAVAQYADCISVSFDGTSARAPSYVRGAQRFTELVRAVRIIQKAGAQAHIIATVHPLNIQDIGSYARLAEELHVSFNFSVLSCCDMPQLMFNEESLRELADAMFAMGKKAPLAMADVPVSMNLSLHHGCGAGSRTLSVAADGTVYPCHMLHYPELAMGNIFRGSVEDMLASPVAAQLAACSPETIRACSGCACVPFCGGGCRARAYHASRSLHGADPFCSMISAFYEHVGHELAVAYLQ